MTLEQKIDRLQADVEAIKKALGVNTPAPASIIRLSDIARAMKYPKLKKTKKNETRV